MIGPAGSFATMAGRPVEFEASRRLPSRVIVGIGVDWGLIWESARTEGD